MLASKLTGKEATKENFFSPGCYKDCRILKTAVIYGANASGKSNLLQAIDLFRNLIINSTDLKFGEKLPHNPFKLSRSSAHKPTSLKMEFIAKDNVRYIYGFSFDKNHIIEEHLVSYTTRKATEVFVRKINEKIRFSSFLKGPKKALEEQLQNNHLFLTKAANSNFEQLHVVYSYFTENLDMFFRGFSSTKGIGSTIFSKKKSFEDPTTKNFINEFLRAADTGIESFEVTKRDISSIKYPEGLLVPDSLKELIKEEFTYHTDVIHTSCDDIPELVKWELEDESNGTIKLFSLASPIIDILNKGGILIFDEINNSLHTLISEFIIQLFNNPETNPHNAQLILTTHDASLLSKAIFRRDQIWFIEKDPCGMSQLYSLCSFDKKEVRWDVPFDKWYLSGRFGALPVVKDLKLKKK